MPANVIITKIFDKVDDVFAEELYFTNSGYYEFKIAEKLPIDTIEASTLTDEKKTKKKKKTK